MGATFSKSIKITNSVQNYYFSETIQSKCLNKKLVDLNCLTHNKNYYIFSKNNNNICLIFSPQGSKCGITKQKIHLLGVYFIKSHTKNSQIYLGPYYFSHPITRNLNINIIKPIIFDKERVGLVDFINTNSADLELFDIICEELNINQITFYNADQLEISINDEQSKNLNIYLDHISHINKNILNSD
jgi:hypothetical protein